MSDKEQIKIERTKTAELRFYVFKEKPSEAYPYSVCDHLSIEVTKTGNGIKAFLNVQTIAYFYASKNGEENTLIILNPLQPGNYVPVRETYEEVKRLIEEATNS